MKALLIGAGIAGTAAALFLQRAGLDCELHELRHDHSDDRGQFLGLAPNGLAVLDALGLGERLRERALPAPTMQFVNAQGRSLGTIVHGSPTRRGVIVRRSALHDVLREALRERGIAVHTGRKLIAVQGADNATGRGPMRARFADGHEASGDLIIGADGIHSRTRACLFPEAPTPAPTGLVGFGGIAHCPDLAPTPQGLQMVYGKRAFFGYIVAPRHEVYWWSTLDAELVRGQGELDEITWRGILQGLHADDGPVVARILRAAWSDAGRADIHDIATLPQWSRGRALLIGDAAHATAPHGGQGASLALEDGAWLGGCLQDVHGIDDIAPALRRFQQQRQARVERIVQWSRNNGAHKAPKNEAMRWLRDQIMPLALKVFAAPRNTAWVYEYEVSSGRLAATP